MLDSLLDQLARQRGIGDAYHNYRGDLLQISRETKTAILAAMGCATSDAAAIERELHERDDRSACVRCCRPWRSCIRTAAT